MPDPIHLAKRPLPEETYPEETPHQRRVRQFAFLAELSKLNMSAARAAHDRIQEAETGTDQADAATLALARASRAVSNLIGIEERLAKGEEASPLQPGDRRRTLLREALHPLTNAEPDAPRRAALRRRIDQSIDDALLTDLDDEMPLGDVAFTLAKRFGLHLDMSKVTDELLGIPPRPLRPPPGGMLADLPPPGGMLAGLPKLNPFERRPEDQAFDFARAPPPG